MREERSPKSMLTISPDVDVTVRINVLHSFWIREKMPFLSCSLVLEVHETESGFGAAEWEPRERI